MEFFNTVPVSWIQHSLTHKFPFILNRNLAKANCTENHVCTSCDTVVLCLTLNLNLTLLTGRSAPFSCLSVLKFISLFVQEVTKAVAPNLLIKKPSPPPLPQWVPNKGFLVVNLTPPSPPSKSSGTRCLCQTVSRSYKVTLDELFYLFIWDFLSAS